MTGGFDEIYRKYYGRVYRYYRSCRAADAEAQDLAQDAFKRLLERMHQIRGDDPWPFLQTIARTVLLNKIREQKAGKRNAKLVEIDAPEVMDLPAPEGPDYAERQEQEQRRRDLYRAIAELPEGQRQALEMWIAGFQYDEIARFLNISLDAVRSRLRDARRQLRARLGADSLPEDEE
jgi:RNA polymerase sigma factor (sigma-70 family)